jgi:hypothetical protein
MKIKIVMTIAVMFLVSCAPSGSAIQTQLAQTLSAIQTQTAYPTYTALPTLTPIVITATTIPYTDTPAPTKTAVPTNTPEPTENPELRTDKVEGVWLVKDEVAPGNWRAVGGDCYAVLFDKFNEQMNMESGSGMIIYVPSNAFTVKFVSYPGSCIWTYLGP